MKPNSPGLTVDIIIEMPSGGFVLIERKNKPHGWALPGGFVDVGETVAAAAVREAKEETGLDVALISMLGVYSDPKRDPRHHNVSVVFVAKAVGGDLAGADDAADARIFGFDNFPPMAFDHALILRDYKFFMLYGVPVPMTR